MISAIAIIFVTLVADNSCNDDIADIRKYLWGCSIDTLPELIVCSLFHDKCAAEIAGATECMGTLTKSISNALTDCDGQGSACTEDIKNIAIKNADATKNIVDLGRGNCSHRLSWCAVDIMKTMKDLDSAYKFYTNAVKDCPSNQLLAPSITALPAPSNTSDCYDVIETVSADLKECARAFITTITDCSIEEVKCAKEVSDVAKKIGATTLIVNKAVTDCFSVTWSCADDILKLTDDLRSATTGLARAAKNCKENLGTTCKSEIMDAASALFSASAGIMNVRSDCDMRMKNKIAA